jgi:hypothetical protein
MYTAVTTSEVTLDRSPEAYVSSTLSALNAPFLQGSALWPAAWRPGEPCTLQLLVSTEAPPVTPGTAGCC